jgi:DNA-binding XRE family transcriptional regulator
VKRLTIIETTNNREPAQAAWWRRTVVQLSHEQLAELIGYSARAVYAFEQGVNGKGKPHKPKAWLRYRRACAGVDAEIRGRRSFTWGC